MEFLSNTKGQAIVIGAVTVITLFSLNSYFKYKNQQKLVQSIKDVGKSYKPDLD